MASHQLWRHDQRGGRDLQASVSRSGTVPRATARKILRALEAQAERGMHIPYAKIALDYGMLGDFESARRWLRQGLLEGHGDWSMLGLRTAEKLEIFGKLAWYWEIADAMKFPPFQMDNPYFMLEQAMRYGRGTVGAITTSTNKPPKTLAVLPFANTSADKTDDSISDGMTEELITSLQKVKGLRVQGRMSSFYFKGKNETPQRVGEQLKVEHLLNGSVSREGSRLRISADLVWLCRFLDHGRDADYGGSAALCRAWRMANSGHGRVQRRKPK